MAAPALEAPRAPRPGRTRATRTNFELYSWLFMRISGILLLVLAVGHVLIMHVLGGGVERVDFKFVQLRWQSTFWRTWDWMMLSLALIHGVNGWRVVILDYAR
jgi:succinate dehydrogenase / fumarate reductase membrane anchor subunit